MYLQGVVSAAAPRAEERHHQTEKPIGLLEQLVEIAPACGTVLDPFMGAGSTLDAARNRGRNAIGFEISDYWAEYTAKRLAQGSFGEEAA